MNEIELKDKWNEIWDKKSAEIAHIDDSDKLDIVLDNKKYLILPERVWNNVGKITLESVDELIEFIMESKK